MQITTNLKGIENGRANFAYQCVAEALEQGSITNSEYKAYCKRIPMMIKTSGLANTIAFVKAKSTGGSSGAKSYDLLYRQLTIWLANSERSYLIQDFGEQEELIERIVKLESQAYRAVTVEVLSVFQWLRRLADGLLTN